MNKALSFLILLISFTSFAQQKFTVAPTIETSPYAVVQIGPHHRVWQSVTTETDADGNTRYQTNSYTELQTGMNVLQPDGSFVEASEEIEIVSAGAVARKGRHQVIFAANCNSAVGIDMLTADGKRLQSRVLGLSYFDSSNGKSVLIAELQDSTGQIPTLAPNQVIYIDAFKGLKAHIRYTYTKAGFEQDIILRQQPAPPESYGMSPQTTRLQVLTEFLNPPTPSLEQKALAGMTDESLDFGDMKVGRGKAFSLLGDTADANTIPVGKTWTTIGNRVFLVEEVPFPLLKPKLDSLPPQASLQLAPDGVLHTVSTQRRLPATQVAGKSSRPIMVASVPMGGNGVVLDYTTMSSATNYTFQGDTTYYVSGTVNLSSTTTIEGGAVIKYTNTTSAKLSLSGSLVCKTSPYRPVVFTSKDDNTVGQSITGSTGVPTNYNGGTYLDVPSSPTYKYLRMSYAGTGISGYPDNGVWHCQFVRCSTGITAIDTDVKLRNVLFSQCGTGVYNGYGGDALRGEHVTADQLNKIFDSPSSTAYLTNSILTAVTNIGTNVNRYNCVTNSSGSGIYQTVGAGSYYLADGSTNRNAGTTNINATLLSDLKQRTTYPPIELTNNITVDTTLTPQAQRDTDTLDLGYHYDPIDYVVSGRTLTNSTLTLTNGVALATYGSSSTYGIYIRKGGNLVSQGSALALNQIVRYNTVQEQANTNWSAATVAHGVKVSTDGTTKPTGNFQFTGWSLLAGQGNFFYADYPGITTPFVFKDCQFGPGTFHAIQCSVALTNCLWERPNLDLEDDGGDYNYYGYNNLFRAGLITLDRNGSAVWKFNDNLFDQSSIFSTGTITHDYNGYVTNKNRLSPNGTHDKILTNSPTYQTSYLGSYYYPTNDGMLSLLLNAGSRNATNAGLYHYTITTNQLKEASSTVDIGFHYVAVDANGLPVDSNGDGVPDYLQDRNGNGVYDSGDSADWHSLAALGDTNLNLRVYTPLK